MEIWKDIENYEGLYQISNYGRVKSLKRITSNGRKVGERILKTRISNGYENVCLKSEGIGKTFFIHRLVAIHFIPNPNNYSDINHKDEKRNNNYYKNLEWCTKAYNNSYGKRLERVSSKLKGITRTEETKKLLSDKHSILYKCIETGEINTANFFVEKYKITNKNGINSASNPTRRQKTCGGFHWEKYNAQVSI